MSQHPSHDLIGITDVAAKLPQFISKVPNLLSGLKQAYLRTQTPQQASELLLKKQ